MKSNIHTIVKNIKKKALQLEVLAKSIEGKYLWKHILWTDNPGYDEITIQFDGLDYIDDIGLQACVSVSGVTTDEVTGDVYTSSDHSGYSEHQLQHFIETCVNEWEKVK